MAESLLHHQSLNPTTSPTLLFIHGAFGDGSDWDMVIPYIPSTYHILLPDLPGHGSSTPTHPIYSLANSASALADLICAKAQGGKAHIIGLSMGAHVAIELAEHYPDVCLTVLVSGFQVFESGSVLGKYMPQALWLQSRVDCLVPKSVMKSLMSGADLPPSYPSLELCRQVGAPMATGDGAKGKWPEPWPARTLVIAAGKAGVLPTADHPEDAIRLAEIGRKGNAQTVAYTHPEMRHPWNRQDPELFARLVVAWIEKGEVVDEFIRLTG